MSSERNLQLLATFHAIGLDIDVQTFENRLLIQKSVYFLEQFDADLGYTFGMYIRGPYSPTLARDAYTLQELDYSPDEIKAVHINSNVRSKMRAFMDSIDKLVDNKKNRQYWLELLASLHFLFKHSYPRIKTFKEAKNTYKLAPFGDDVRIAFGILEKHCLLLRDEYGE